MTLKLTDELLKTIQSTLALAQDLLNDVKDDEQRLSALEVKLESISDMGFLLKTIKDENYSTPLATRVALLEQSIEIIKEDIDRILNQTADDTKLKKEKNLYTLKLVAMSAPGLISLILLIINLITK